MDLFEAVVAALRENAEKSDGEVMFLGYTYGEFADMVEARDEKVANVTRTMMDAFGADPSFRAKLGVEA